MAKHDPAQSRPGQPDPAFRDRAAATLADLGDSASSQVAANPLIALAGGIAVGAVIAALLPQTNRESDLLKPAGDRLNEAGRSVADKAREASKAKVDQLAGSSLRDLFRNP